MTVMLKQKVTILLIGFMCFSSVSGFFTVICHGSDGHIAVEPVDHNHCQCPETAQTGHRDKFSWAAIGSSADHDHCVDSIATSNIIIPARKNVRLSTHKVSTANLALKSNSTSSTSFFGHWAARGYDFSSFFTPLRSVILLA